MGSLRLISRTKSAVTPEEVFEECFEFGPSGEDDPDNQLLYHYTRAETALKSILVSRALRLSPYRSMRDPLENKKLPIIVDCRTAADGERLSPRVVTQLLDALRGRMRVLSLTMDASAYTDVAVRTFGRGYARPRMWEHYAEKHAGVCLAFSAAAMCGPFLENIRAHGAANCKPVVYTQGGFVASPGRVLDGHDLAEDTAADLITKHVIEHEDHFWFMKLMDWETEYEYRFVLFRPDMDLNVSIDVPFGNCLRGIILGEKFDSTHLPEALRLGEELKVPVMHLDWGSGRPSVRSV